MINIVAHNNARFQKDSSEVIEFWCHWSLMFDLGSRCQFR